MPSSQKTPPGKASAAAKPQRKAKLVPLLIVAGIGLLVLLIFRLKPEPPPEVDTKRAANIKGVFAGGPTSTRINSKPAETRGAFAADELIQLAGSSGSVVVVREVPGFGVTGNSDMGRFISMISSEADSFKDRLKGKGRFSFLADVELPRADGTTRTQWPTGGLSKLLQSTPANATIVMFCLPPAQISEGEKAQIRSRPGKIVIVAGSEPEVKPLIEQRLINLAVTSKVPIPAPPSTGSESPIQWVARVHTVLKP
jgi:hypothetical protein